MSKFKEIFLHKQDLLRNRPDKCRVETKAESHLIEDFRSHVKTRGFDVVLDQPENMGSSDLGPRPGELLLAALAACHEVTYRLYAEAMNIDLQGVKRNRRIGCAWFLNVDDEVYVGFSEVFGAINMVSDASDKGIFRPYIPQLRQPRLQHRRSPA